jgi:hypothetical protein
MTPLLIITALVVTLFIWMKNNSKPKTKSYSQDDFLNEQLLEIKSKGIPKMPASLHDQLNKILPSHDSQMEYLPCRVTLYSGEVFDNVYVAEVKKYLKVWGILPDLDSGKKSILINDVAKVEESPNRLPAQLATKLYKAGESGMGYTIFTMILKDGNQIPIVTGNAVDFINLPNGYNTKDIVDVLPHEGRNNNPQNGPEYIWCLYDA